MASLKDALKDMRSFNDIESTVNRILAHKGVQGIVITDHSGAILRSTLDNIQTQQYSTLVTALACKSKSVVRDYYKVDPEDNLTFLRIRSKKNEIMVAETKPYLLMVIQEA
ncbi:hypothetical protein HDU92_006208 [Lobulomyces angularis]|nr:hypothetical protein HDU92_006208 [Lobulomyces angularis]